MNKKRVYMGRVGVVPRKDFKRHIEELQPGPDSGEFLRAHLESSFELPLPPPAAEATDADYVLDIFVLRHQRGEAAEVIGGDFWIPMLWRPEVEVRGHVHALRSGRTLIDLRVRKAMAWGAFLRYSLNPRVYLGFSGPPMDHLRRLLDEAVLEILEVAAAKLRD